MRHLHFVQSTEPLEGGGLGRAALELSSAMCENRVSSQLVATGAEAACGEGWKVYSRRGPTRTFFAPALRREAHALVRKADIVHGHGFYVAPNWFLGREARRQNRPLVYHPHGMFEPWILARSRGKKRVAHLLFEDANFRYAALWRALTGKEANQVRAQGIRAPIVVCPNGIDLSSFDSVPALRARTEREKDRRELLFLARLHPKKGLLLLVEAWQRIPREIRNGWCVVIAGPDELDHRSEVEAALHSAGIVDEFQFIGSVSGVAKLGALARADAFVLPSHSEGFSVAILEAMACGLPVLATHACNFPELAERGGGWCVADEVESMSAALRAMLGEDDTSLRQRGAAARALVESRYTWSSIAETLSEACRSVIVR